MLGRPDRLSETGVNTVVMSLSGVDRHDCLSPSFSVLCELWVELVLFHIAPHSVHPPQYGPSSRSLPPTFIVVTFFATFDCSLSIHSVLAYLEISSSHLHRCYLLCNVRFFSYHHMAIPRLSERLSEIYYTILNVADSLCMYSRTPCMVIIHVTV